MLRILMILTLCASIGACSSMQQNTSNDRAAICKELKRRIIFNGATGNNTEATQQRAELGNLTKDYREQGC